MPSLPTRPSHHFSLSLPLCPCAPGNTTACILKRPLYSLTFMWGYEFKMKPSDIQCNIMASISSVQLLNISNHILYCTLCVLFIDTLLQDGTQTQERLWFFWLWMLFLSWKSFLTVNNSFSEQFFAIRCQCFTWQALGNEIRVYIVIRVDSLRELPPHVILTTNQKHWKSSEILIHYKF